MLKKGVISFFEYLLMLMIILEFNTPYLEFPTIGKLITLFIIISIFILVLFYWRNLSKETFAFIFLVLLGALFPLLNVYEGTIFTFVKLYLVILPLLLLLLLSYGNSLERNVKGLLNKFSDIVLVIALFSLFFWFFGSLLSIISSTMLIPNSWAGERLIATYYGLYFETQGIVASSGGEEIIRNTGIFNEAPMYNMILCTSLAIEMFQEQKRKMYIFIIAFTIITTISTTGYIFLFVLLSFKSFNYFGGKYKLQSTLIFPIILLISSIIMSGIIDNKKETAEGSYNYRSIDIVKCIEVGIEHPITGVGIMYKAAYAESNFFGFSNSLFGVFAHGGFYFLLLYLFPFLVVPLILLLKNKKSSIGGILLSYFGVFSFTVSEYKVLTIFMLSCSLSYWYFVVFKNKDISPVKTGRV